MSADTIITIANILTILLMLATITITIWTIHIQRQSTRELEEYTANMRRQTEEFAREWNIPLPRRD